MRAAAGCLALALLFGAAAHAATLSLDEFERARRSQAIANGERVSYVPLGAAHGVPVLLIHGYTDNARDWVPLVPYLDPQRRLLLVELRGHGHSSAPECCYTRYDFAYDLKLFLDALHIERADLVGHSLGSIVAQALAEEWPQRTRRVVLISSTGGPLPGAAPEPRFDYATPIRQLREPIDPDSPFMLEWWGSPGAVDAEFLRRQRLDSARIPLRVWLAVLDQGLGLAGLQDGLARLKAPVLLIWGSKDPIMVESDRASLRRALPGAQVKIFEGRGHNPFWEDPPASAEVINAFLAAP
ncbi:MAG: alpha/beta hydrolase [Gammaproteobacteria bacterium]|nr:alpha/beta hydrolase [Gammaproteobacteria bacterium]